MGFLSSIFVNPAFLVAAAGAAVPIMLHLIYRRRSKEVPFSSLKFLHRSVKRTAHRKRLEELLLLLLRVALIALLALALARPFLGAAGKPGSSAYTSMVLVLDDSGSMTCQHNKTPRFDRAKAAADKLCAGLVQGDAVFLRLASGRRLEKYRGEEDYGKLTSNRAYIIEELLASQCTYARGDLAGEIAGGLEKLARRTDPNRELYVLSDMQRTTLRGLAARLAKIDDQRISVVFVDVSDPDYRNAAVTDLAVRSRTRAAGEPVAVQAQVRNTSEKSMEVVAALYVGREGDAQRISEQRLKLEPGATHSLSFTCRLAGSGVHTGWVEVSSSADSMSFDNQRFFRTEMFRRVPVLLIEKPAAGGRRPGSFYILRALDPSGGSGLIAPRLAGPGEAAKLPLDNYGAVILSGLSEIPEELGAALREYVAGGGGLIVFPSTRAAAGSYAAGFGDHGDGRGPLLAAALGAPLKVPPPTGGGESEGLAVAGLDYTHPVLLPFKGLARGGFRQVRVRAGLQLELPEKSRDREMITLAGARPFLVAREFGRGRSYLFASPADAASSSLPLSNAFLPLLYRMVYDLAELGERRGEHLVGGQAVLPFPEKAGKLKVQVTSPGPGARTVELETSGTGRNSCTYGPLAEPGLYQYEVLPGGARNSFAVNPDPRESELEPVSREELEKLFAGFRHVEFADGAEGLDKVTARIRGGSDLSGTILALLLALAVFECFFANYMTGSRKAGAAGAADAESGT